MNMEASDRFAVFILSHGRPDRVVTYKTLRRQGYTGDIYVVVDDEDSTLDDYRGRFGNQVIVFDKLAVSKEFDTGDNFNDRRAVVFARNACFGIAQSLGLDYFLELDDDYTSFVYKFSERLEYQEKPVKSLDQLFGLMLAYYQSIPAVTVAFAQNGDFMGGKRASTANKVRMKRKCMNTFFCATNRPFQFVGRVNEDVNTYVSLGNRGLLLLTICNVAIIQRRTQQNSGGMSELYLEEGTYRKSFYPVMYAPSCVKIRDMGDKHRRIHHSIRWANAVPRIIDEVYRKSQG